MKQTVNFDDPGTYHLYYGDQEGTPGTILTFFPWQGMSRGKNGRQGSGTVHHIAFRTPDENEQLLWQRSLLQGGYHVTGVRDRKYFKSIYLHEPGGVLFEIATDPPGFAVDEPLPYLGQALQLPDDYEPRRSEIENNLPPLRFKTAKPHCAS